MKATNGNEPIRAPSAIAGQRSDFLSETCSTFEPVSPLPDRFARDDFFQFYSTQYTGKV